MPRPLPNTSTWQPREPGNARLVSTALAERCATLERKILLAAQSERDLAFDAFNSGTPVEDLLREAIRELLPCRYETTTGTVVDARGFTSGEMDIVVFNSHWFPQVHAPATPGSKRKLLPFEGVYAVGEVKQTLTESSLDEAMEKLVTCHRLRRAPTPRSRITENRVLSTNSDPGLSNPLFSFVVGASAAGELQPLIERFYDINKSLNRLDVVRGLCVLGAGTVTWAVRRTAESGPAVFMADDLALPIVPAYFPASQYGPALFTLVENLLLHLYHSVLGPEDIASQYGPLDRGVKLPKDPRIHLPPDGQLNLNPRPKSIKRKGNSSGA